MVPAFAGKPCRRYGACQIDYGVAADHRLADDAPKVPVAIGSTGTAVSAAAGDHLLDHGVGAEF